MNKIIVLFIGFCSITGFSQQESYRNEILNYFDVNGTILQYSRAIDQLFTMLSQQYASAKVESDVWGNLDDEIRPTALNNIQTMLVSIYQSHFSKEEIESLTEFYGTSVGQQLISNASKLDAKQQKEADRFYATPVGVKVQQQGESLKKNISEASETWSRDLYQELVARLATKGYALPK